MTDRHAYIQSRFVASNGVEAYINNKDELIILGAFEHGHVMRGIIHIPPRDLQTFIDWLDDELDYVYANVDEPLPN